MSRPRFLADEDLHQGIVRVVRRTARELEFSTVVAAGWAGASDHELLEAAWRERWIIVSHDVNSLRQAAEMRVSEGREIHGVCLVPRKRVILDVAECLTLIWEASEFEEWHNRVVFLPF